MVACGIWRGSQFIRQLQPYHLLTKQPVVLQGQATVDAVYGDKTQLSFDMSHLRLLGPVRRPLTGTVGIKGFGPAMVYRGDIVQASGKLYPTRGSKQASLSFADIVVLKRGRSPIDGFRRRFAAGLNSVLPEPLGSLGLGLLIGQRTTLPAAFNDQLSTVSLTHIVAVSGYNLMIIVAVVKRLLHKRSKYQAALTITGLVVLFIILVGTSASIIRAALVCLLSLAAWYYGRQFRPHVIILLTAAVTAAWNPVYVWSDIGWWLSFLAFAGILLLAPLVQNRWGEPRKLKLLLTTLLETSAAQIMTLPLIMFIFGRLSLIGLLANLVIVPVVPLAMLWATVAGLSSLAVPSLAGWVAWPARLTLDYIVGTIQSLAAVPHAAVNQPITWWQMAGFYGLLTTIMFILWRKNGKITEMKVESMRGEA
jgi:competence protein ComEC